MKKFLVVALLVGGCATFRTAFVASEKACQIASLPGTLSGLVPQAEAILAGANWEAGLAALALTEGVEQVKCLVQAVEAGIQASHATDGGTKAALAMTAEEETILAHAHAYLIKHPVK